MLVNCSQKSGATNCDESVIGLDGAKRFGKSAKTTLEVFSLKLKEDFSQHQLDQEPLNQLDTRVKTSEAEIMGFTQRL